MKISVCVTTLNEEYSISALLESLLLQTKKPDEVVIVDGGSSDRTVQIIRHYQKKDKRIKLLVEPGSCAHGRNVSIDLAKNTIIALTDAGCIARKDWLEKITYPFKHKSVGLVAGFYDMPANDSLQRALNVYHGIPPERFDPISFLPSARSVAFRKSVWEKVGGFNERLKKAGEDTLFFYSCVKEGVKIVRVKEARVVWEEAGKLNLISSLKKFFEYAKGDAQTKIWWHPQKQLASHNIKISFIFIRYIIALIFFIYTLFNRGYLPVFYILTVLYLLWPIIKWRDVIKDYKARLYLPLIQILSDIVVMIGFICGTKEIKKG